MTDVERAKGSSFSLQIPESRPVPCHTQKLNNPYSNDADYYAINALNGVPVALFVDGKMIATQVGKRDKLGPSALGTVVSLTEHQAIALTSGAKLELRVEVAHTRRTVDPSMTFDLTRGRGPLLAALDDSCLPDRTSATRRSAPDPLRPFELVRGQRLFRID